MKRTLILSALCVMAGVNGFGQAALRNGVYEFSRSGGTQMEVFKFDRTLIVKDDIAHYWISDSRVVGYGSAQSGIWGSYLLTLERQSGGLYTARNEYIEPDFDKDYPLAPYLPIELNITTGDSDTVEVEIVKGHVVRFYSGGQYFRMPAFAPLEKQTLAFVRELTAEDETMLLLSNAERYETGITIEGVAWATRNVGEPGKFVDEPKDRGGLYTFDEAQTACPPGWRLPTREELAILVKSKGAWTGKGREFVSNINIFLPAGGYRKNDGVEYQHKVSGQYWSSTPHDESTGTSLYFDSDGVHPPHHTAKDYGFSVRCVAVNRK